ncbi:hypothetical protein [Gottfriedia solisilvae]|uniref:Lipoprotein n=1 Tax=Gottfriedia solisilvae TaxID=1516104 RepID=A0A8J3F071_9BACI|nr:hypothetical protein [Gottfriedia solisilvae]GGI11570.1 hypothetical protein GCM10007380_08500 [Gottfriedia solisilvae]
MNKKIHLKISILLILFLLTCYTLVGCNKVDNVRDPISFKKLDMEYVKNNDPSFFIDDLRVYINDKRIGKQVDLSTTDYNWVFDLLMEDKNKKEIYDEKKPKTYKIKLIFAEYGWTFEHDRSKYNGKQSIFYISENLKNQFIRQYLASHPINTVLTKTKFNWDEEIKGYITIMEYASVGQGIMLELEGNDGDLPIKVYDIIPKNTAPLKADKTIPFTIRLSEYREKLNNSSYIALKTNSGDGMTRFDYDRVH